ncbi:MAG TPA: S1 RNA-binding domain-containing protein, partial [Sphingomicrobium sp.]|nr:S1 RNA-binding domain-containing protein [Sphingomicrobium sp.]
MAKVMLIDATHPEETRVAVADGRKLEEFDVEVASRRPLKGNIYLAKVTRVEPSLQAAFVEYGGNRHGFLAFSEIHPDYYRIPVADRERLLREAAVDHDDDDDDEVIEHQPAAPLEHHAEDDADAMAVAESSATEASFEESAPDAGAAIAPTDDGGSADNIWQHASETRGTSIAHGEEAQPEAGASIAPVDELGQPESESSALPPRAADELVSPWEQTEASSGSAALETPRFELRSAPVDEITTAAPAAPASSVDAGFDSEVPAASAPDVLPAEGTLEVGNGDAELPPPAEAQLVEVQTTAEVVDVIGGEEPAPQDDPEVDEEQARRRRQRNLRRYKSQEVIKRRQILLVQVTK